MTHAPKPAAVLQLPARPNLEKLKKDAKQLLQNYRAEDDSARRTVADFHPRPTEFSGLRDAQLVVARQYGCRDWMTLCTAVELALLRSRSLAEQAELFITHGCLRYNGDDRAWRYQRAAALLEQEPRIAWYSLYSALVAGQLDAVRHFLEKDSSTLNQAGGPLMRPPLLYLTYSRVPAANEDVLAIMRLLLAKGADPDSHVKLDDGESHFSAMCGAMGEGERGPVSCIPHPCADGLVKLLLDAGANPNEAQGLYNTQFTGSIDKWLPLLIAHGLNNKHLAWGKNPQATFDYFLAQAAGEGKFERIKLLLEHGANPDAVNIYNKQSCYSQALLTGHEEIAQYLLNHGARPRPLTTEDEFWIASRKQDKDRVLALLQKQPQLLQESVLLRGATAFGIDYVLWLVQQGFSINGQTKDGRTVLMDYALWNDVEAVKRLLAEGANPDLTDFTYQSTALGFALHNRNWQVIELLAENSNNLLDVCRIPHPVRARFLLERKPALAATTTPMGNTPLHLVSQACDEDIDVELSAAMIDLLLQHGADIEARNREGLTPLQWYRKLGVDAMVELLQERGATIK